MSGFPDCHRVTQFLDSCSRQIILRAFGDDGLAAISHGYDSSVQISRRSRPTEIFSAFVPLVYQAWGSYVEEVLLLATDVLSFFTFGGQKDVFEK